MSMGFMRSPNRVTARISHDVLLVALVFLVCGIASWGNLVVATDTSARKAFDITANGAKPEAGGDQGRKLVDLPGGGNDENAKAITMAWEQACKGEYKGPAKVVVPKGTFVTGPVVLQGPCTSSNDIVVEILGELKATTDLKNYPGPEWLKFDNIDGLIITGDGVVNGQGEKTYTGKGEEGDGGGANPPDNIKLIKVKNGLVEGIKSLNSKYFHFHLTGCSNVTLDRVTITAPGDSPNTDGCHISDSDNVKVINSVIGTGDDCVSIGQGNNQTTVSNVTCGPGHGLSVGSLGKYKDEKPVSGVSITNCKLTDTTNGARVKTYSGPNAGEASGIVFDGLVMERVKNPIVIDQHYGEKKSEGPNIPDSGQDSLYKLKDIKFKNIKGTATGEPIMTFACSGKNPCDAVELEDIELTVGGGAAAGAGTAASNKPSGCFHAKLTTKGTVKPQPPACQ